MGTSKISWTDATWQPVVGCTRISPGCRGCYAARMARRQAGMARARRAKGQDPGRSAHYEKVENWDGVELVPEALSDPLKWRKPRRVFVCSMGDLFHEDVPYTFVTEVWSRMASCPQHTFQILTKRPNRMLEYITRLHRATAAVKPLPNVHLGVTAENQATANERIPLLLQIPAAKRFVSCEPLLGEIDLTRIHYDGVVVIDSVGGFAGAYEPHERFPGKTVKNAWPLDLVIVGGETGPGARPMHPQWARSLHDQCTAVGTAFHFKQWGEWLDAMTCDQMNMLGAHTYPSHKWPDGSTSFCVGSKRAGHLLDGVEHRDLPE